MSALHELLEELRAGGDPLIAPADLDPLLAWLTGSFGRKNEERDGEEGHGELPRPEDDPVLLRMVLFRLDELLFDNGTLDLRAAGVGPDQPVGTRRSRFRRLARAFHPDRFPDLADWLTQRSQAVHQAYGRFKQDPEDNAIAAPPPGPARRTDSRSVYRKSRAKALGRAFQRLAILLRRRFGPDRFLAHKIVGALAILALLPAINLWLVPNRDSGAAAQSTAGRSEKQVDRPLTLHADTQANTQAGDPAELQTGSQTDPPTGRQADEEVPPLLIAARRTMNPRSDGLSQAAAPPTVDDQLRAMGLRTDTERLYSQVPSRTEAPLETPPPKPQPIAEPVAEPIAQPDAEPSLRIKDQGARNKEQLPEPFAELIAEVSRKPVAEPAPLPAGKLELGFFAKHPVGLLLAAFHSDLESGNLPGLVSRFAPDAHYGRLRGNRQLARHFRELFDQAPERQVNLHVQRLERDGKQWRAEADLEILVRGSDSIEKVRAGRAVLRLGEQNGALTIQRIENQ